MSEEKWDLIIKPKSSWIDLRFKELWKYRDLLLLFVKRDFVAVYKQTVLGPLWFFIQPILTKVMFAIVFGYFGKLDTDGMPGPLFYLTGLTLWNYFSDCLTKTSETFIKNQNIFGKVFFPRLIVPLSITVSSLLKFGIQFILFALVCCYYYFFSAQSASINPTQEILVVPLLIIMMAGLSLGFGIIFSSITTKYKDMNFLLAFGVQLLMYVSSVVIPISQMGEYAWIFKLNPMVNIIEAFKYAFLGAGQFSWFWLGYSFVFMCVLLFFGTIIFNRVEKSFMDTV